MRVPCVPTRLPCRAAGRLFTRRARGVDPVGTASCHTPIIPIANWHSVRAVPENTNTTTI
eukprot:4129070-Heterocapsa_arctica.AAC.1